MTYSTASGGGPRWYLCCFFGRRLLSDIRCVDSWDSIPLQHHGTTIHELRSSIQEEFDADMIESNYYFEVDGIRLSKAQEELQEEFDADMIESNYYFEVDGIRLSKAQEERACAKELVGRRVELKNRRRFFADILANAGSKTIVGVLGNTGVGESSLLNALLDEAAVLPTSDSRGCTAAVVELRFNNALKNASDEDEREAPVYRGEVEFITQEEWARELKLLVDECSTQEEKTIYARAPEEQRQPDAANAWSKINHVYGRGTLDRYLGQPKERVYDRLMRDKRVMSVLTPQQPGSPYNSVLVSEGTIAANQAKTLLQPHGKIPAKLGRSKKKWANAFRKEINDYVYRKGNGDQPQTWPLIRKVVLPGPWKVHVLTTGACLVDLPGVRDSNAARAKVSEHYLQNCNEIWIVAPIKRAVDDGTAKELLGEQFKQRLLMDGAYGNVSLICTQTDDIEATETMRDHEDVARKIASFDTIESIGTDWCYRQGCLESRARRT